MSERVFDRSPVRRVARQSIVAQIHATRFVRWNGLRALAAKRRPARRVKTRASARARLDADAFFAFAVFLSVLSVGDFGTIGAVAVSGLAVLYAVVRMRQLGEILMPRALLLVIPAFAVFSTLWSESPPDTLKYSLEFALTVVVGLLLSATPRPKEVLWGIFLAFSIYLGISIGFGHTVDLGDYGQTAFSGLNNGKNLFGDLSSCGLLVSLACVAAGLEDNRLFRAMLAAGMASVEVYALIEARSAGAVMGATVAISCFIFLLALRPARLALRLIATMIVAFATAVIAILDGGSLIEDAITFFDKDPTLTGRTYLWQRAADFIAEKPMLGKGFNAFWLQGNLDAEGLWQYAGIAERQGFNFHNTVIEILVDLGWVGVIVFATVGAVGLALLLRRVMLRPSLALCFWLSFLVFELVRMPIESLGTGPFSHETVLLFAAFGAAFACRRPVTASTSPRRRRRTVRVSRPIYQAPLRRRFGAAANDVD